MLFWGGACQNKALASDSFAEKVEALRGELGGYHAGLRAEERAAAAKRINAALLAILREEESLAADAGDILGGEGQFALIFGDWASAGNRRYRVVTLRPESDRRRGDGGGILPEPAGRPGGQGGKRVFSSSGIRR